MSQLSIALEARFVDREREQHVLESLLHQTSTGKGCVVFVIGEAGVGKTRLVKELRKHAESSGTLFAEGSSYEQDAVSPYSPWIDVIQNLLTKTPADSLRKLDGWIVSEVGRLVPSILPRVEEMGLKGWLQGSRAPAMATTPSADQDRVRFFQAITEFLGNLARNRTIIIFLDDLGWADQASLQLLHYIARRAPEHRIMFVATYRDVELPDDHPIAKMTLDLNRLRTLHRISLVPFSHEHTSQLMTALLREPVSEELVQLVHNRTGGNPFFVEEITRSFSEEGLLQRSAGRWTLREMKEVVIPASITALIRQRTGHLGEDCTRLLSIASLIGMEFDFEVLKRVASQSEEALMNLLDTALKSHLVQEKKVGKRVSYIFRDEQVRDFLSQQVSLLRRRKFHLALGAAMEEAYKDTLDEHLGEIAHHFIEAADVARAKEYSVKAGKRFVQIHAHADAHKHFTNALELTPEDELESRLDLLMRLGQLGWIRGNHSDVLQFCGQALNIAKKLDAKTKLAELYGLMGLSEFLHGNSAENALQDFSAGLQALGDTEDSIQGAFLCSQIARVYTITGRLEPGQLWIKRALDIATRLGANEVIAHCYQTLGLTLPLKDKELILGYFEKALRLASEQKLEDVALRAHTNLASTLASLKGDYRRAKEIFLQGIGLARSIGYLDHEVWMRGSLLSDALLYLGEWESCEKQAPAIISLAKELGEKNLWAPYYTLAYIAAARGHLPEAREMLECALGPANRSGWPELLIGCYMVRAKIHLAENKLSEAEKNLLVAIEQGKKMTFGFSTFEPILELVRLGLKKGDLEEASAYYTTLQKKASEVGENWAFAIELWAKGLVSEARGNVMEGIEALEKSVELFQLVGRKYDLAQTLVDLSRLETKAHQTRKAEEASAEAGRMLGQLGIGQPRHV